MHIYRTLCPCFVVLGCASVAIAANDVWDANGAIPRDGIWGTGANWADNTMPGINDTATFNIGGANAIYSVTFDANPAAIQNLTITNSLPTFLSSGGMRTLNVTAAGGGQDIVLNNSALILGTVGNPISLNAADDLAVDNFSFVHVKHGSRLVVNDILIAGAGEIIADGFDSRLYASSVSLGNTGATGRLTYSNSASGIIFFTANVGVSSSAAAAGVLNVETGADVDIRDFLNIGTGTAGTGTVNIHGTNSRLSLNYGEAVVGSAAGGTAAINIGTITSGGVLDTGFGSMTINRTGTVTVGSGANTGSLAVTGPFNIVGGDLIINSGSTFFRSLTDGFSITSSGSATLADGLSTYATTNVASGGSLSLGRGLNVNGGTFVVDGVGSSVVANITEPNIVSKWGESSGANLTFRNGASGMFPAGIDVGTMGASAKTINVESGAALATGPSNLGFSSTLTVTGTGSTWTVDPGDTLTIGPSIGAGSTTAVVNVVDSGSLTVGLGGTTVIHPRGAMNINGGSADLKTIDFQGGAINLTAGSLSFLGNLTVGTGGMLGTNLTLSTDRQLFLTGTTSIDPAELSTLSGGTLNTGNLVVNGTFNFDSGTLGLITAGASTNVPIVSNSPNTTINVNANNVSLGSASSFTGFQHQGTLNVGSNAVTLNSAGYARLGVLTTLANGTISAPNGVDFSNGVDFASGSNFLGRGTINAGITGEADSIIEANGALALGSATSPAGFNFDGELRTKQFPVTLNSSAQATLGNLTTIGNGATAGMLTATNGVVVEFGDAITGYGTVISTNTLAQRTFINGVAQGNSSSQRLTFAGYVKGVGTFTNVNFTGTFSPGLSPTVLPVGNVAFSPTSTLIMELGGTTPGSGYDQLQSNGSLGLDGTLAVTLVNGFNPAVGNSFDLFDWASVAGTFDTLQLPALAAGLSWNTTDLHSTGVLSVSSSGIPGNYNFDGTVNAADYVVWRKGVGIAPTPANYTVWRTHFGRSNDPGAGGDSVLDSPGGTAVPEPTSRLPLVIALWWLASFNIKLQRCVLGRAHSKTNSKSEMV